MQDANGSRAYFWPEEIKKRTEELQHMAISHLATNTSISSNVGRSLEGETVAHCVAPCR